MATWWLIPICSAFLLSVVFIEVVRMIAERYGLVDVSAPSSRKIHVGSIALGGGVGIYLAFTLCVLAVLLFTDHFVSGDIAVRQFIGFLLGGAVLIAGGLLDDKYDLPPRFSFLFPLLAVLLAVASGIGVSKITNPFGGYFEIGEMLSSLLTAVWLLMMIYTTKLLDGIDGLVGGVTSIGAFVLGSLALTIAFFQPDVALLSFIAVAAILGFVVWNWHPARIFLGEGGSTFLGFLLGVLAVISGGKILTALLVMGIPAMDLLFVFSERMRGGVGAVVRADRRHFHHRLLAAGLSQRQVALFYFVFSLIFGLSTLIFDSWQKVFALILLFFILFLFIHALSSRRL